MEKTDQPFWDICILGQLLERGYNETSLKNLFFERHKELPTESFVIWDNINTHKNKKEAFVKKQEFTEASEQRSYERESQITMYTVLTNIKKELIPEEIKVQIEKHWESFALFFPVFSK